MNDYSRLETVIPDLINRFGENAVRRQFDRTFRGSELTRVWLYVERYRRKHPNLKTADICLEIAGHGGIECLELRPDGALKCHVLEHESTIHKRYKEAKNLLAADRALAKRLESLMRRNTAIAKAWRPEQPVSSRQTIKKGEATATPAAFHEAGHAVIGRVLNICCTASIGDRDSVGDAMIDVPSVILQEWEYQGRFRELSAVFHASIITLMAGEESAGMFTERRAGDHGDQAKIALMLAEVASKDQAERVEARLRFWTRTLCRRHAERIKLVAGALLQKGSLTDEEICALTGVGKRPDSPFGAVMRAAARAVT